MAASALFLSSAVAVAKGIDAARAATRRLSNDGLETRVSDMVKF